MLLKGKNRDSVVQLVHTHLISNVTQSLYPSGQQVWRIKFPKAIVALSRKFYIIIIIILYQKDLLCTVKLIPDINYSGSTVMKDLFQQTPENINWHVWDGIPRIASSVICEEPLISFLLLLERLCKGMSTTLKITDFISQFTHSECIRGDDPVDYKTPHEALFFPSSFRRGSTGIAVYRRCFNRLHLWPCRRQKPPAHCAVPVTFEKMEKGNQPT